MDFGYLLGGQGVQLPDPVRQAQSMMSLAQIANQNKLAQYTLAAAQRKDAAATGVGQALGGLDINDDAAVTRAIQSADPEARQGILDAVLTARKSSAETGFKKSESAAKDWEVKGKQAAMMGNVALYLANKPDVSQQDVVAAASNLKSLGMDPNAILPPPGVDPRAHWQALAGQSMDAVKQIEMQGQAATRAETATHNRATEGNQAATLAETTARDRANSAYQQGELGIRSADLQNSNLRARAAAVQADPFGLSGLNQGMGGGAQPPAQTGMPSSNVIPQATQAARDGQAYDLLQQERSQAANIQEASALDREIQTRFPNGRPAMQGPQAPGGAPIPSAAMQAGLQGEDFLKALPPPVAGMVKAMVEGRQAPPAGAALRSPQVQQLMQLANQYDPTFDATTWGARASMAKDWGDQGAIGKSNLAINTVIGHLGDLQKSADAMNNFSFTPANAVVNAVENRFGDPRYKEFNANAGAVAKELERAYRGTGGSQSDIDQMKQELDSSGSPQQLSGVIQKYVNLLQSKIEANADAYRKTMGRDPPPLLSSKAQSTRDTLAGNQSGASGSPVKINGDDGYNMLKSGQLFVGPDGVTRRKP